MRTINTIAWSAKQINTMNSKGSIKYDSYIQRSLVWDLLRKSLLVRTVVNGFPRIPEIYATRELGSKVYQLLDGKQRINCIIDYMNDRFALDETLEDIIDEEGETVVLAGKKFSELPDYIRDIISSYSFRIAYYDDLTDDEVAELFYLVNNAKPLSAIEHLRANCPALRDIQEIAKHPIFSVALSDKAIEKYGNEDCVVKSYIMLMKNPCLDNKVVRPVMANMTLTDDDKNRLNNIFDYILRTNSIIANCELLSDEEKDNDVVKKAAQKIAKKILVKTHMFSIIPLVDRCIKNDIDVMTFAKWAYQFFNGTKSATKYDDYNERCTSGSGHADNIKVRLEVINDDWDKFIGSEAEDPQDEIEVSFDDSCVGDNDIDVEELLESIDDSELVGSIND